MSAPQIQKQTLLEASRTRVWNALTDSEEFGEWFGMKLNGPFKAGAKMTGQIMPTSVDPDVARMQEPYKGTPVEFWVDRIEPETLFSLKWHPFAIEKNMDYSKEEMTTITFTLDGQADGILLTVTETGFENIPEERRAAALQANEGGWAHQMALIKKYLAKTFN
jgi:uncharacterized protein YndB with AHSA1/START domain